MNSIIWRGKSALDGKPVFACAVKSTAWGSPKTGPMLQTYILRSDIPPGVAARTGQDASICGDCPHRGVADPNWLHPSRGTLGRAFGRTCYVHVPRGPTAVWKAATAGKYYDGVGEATEVGRDQAVRVGTYGDPAAVPLGLWRDLLFRAASWTGYTHQWRRLDYRWAEFLMASVESEAEAIEAHAKGWRTYRVRVAGQELLPSEIVCPGSAEAGKITTCAKCRLCGGNSVEARSIAIYRHGTNENRRKA